MKLMLATDDGVLLEVLEDIEEWDLGQALSQEIVCKHIARMIKAHRETKDKT